MMRSKSKFTPSFLILVVLNTACIRRVEAAYDHSHNQFCVQWKHFQVGSLFSGPVDPGLKPWSDLSLHPSNSYARENSTQMELDSFAGAEAPPESSLVPSSVVCRTEGHSIGIASLVSSVVGPCVQSYDRALKTKSKTQELHEAVEIAFLHDDCNVWWHSQAYNAFPLPYFAYFMNPSTMRYLEVENESQQSRRGICSTTSSLGIVHTVGPHFGSCLHVNGFCAGDYNLLATYNRTSRYRTPFDINEKGRREQAKKAIAKINSLVDRFITSDDVALVERITGQSFQSLMESIRSSGELAVAVLSADRFVYAPEANKRGLHLLRSILANKLTETRRKTLGLHHHPDYAEFMENGYIIKDFSLMQDTEVLELLRMVSGYNSKDIPDLVWILRTVRGNAEDNNLNLHVDTFAPAWKVWLYAQDISIKDGPLHYVKGSHLPSENKLRFLYRASIDPPIYGAGSYGSFRMGQYGHNNSAEESQASIASQRKFKTSNGTITDELEPYEIDEDGVWRCNSCVDDERDYGMRPRYSIHGQKLSLVIADVSGLHCRGLSVDGTLRRTFILDGQNDGGLRRVNPFTYKLAE